MGVRGLTTYIAQNAKKYLDPYELHDTQLVIDGDNLASQLYKENDKHLSAFGGNYDDYFRAVVDFFKMLTECNVESFVLLDGGYEQKKMKTVRERLKGRIGVIKNIIPLERSMALPLHMREVFVNAVKFSNVKIMRCLFEADNEIAILARRLKCPVLSYDSDFYIFDGLYIPYVTISHKIYKKTIKTSKSYEVEVVKKRMKGGKNKFVKIPKKILIQEDPDDEIEHKDNANESYNYLDCCIYQIQNLTEGELDFEMLPLFACLIGNDFIERKVFNKFYSTVKHRRTKKNLSPQQKRITLILDWLKRETLKSAIKKILGRMKIWQREALLNQIKATMRGYSMEYSLAFDYFKLKGKNVADDTDEDFGFDFDKLLESSDEELETEEEISDAGSEVLESEEDVIDEGSESAPENDELVESDASEINEENPEDLGEIQEVSDEEKSGRNWWKNFVFPDWFTKVYYSANCSRFLVDIFRNKRYINYPQVEEFTSSDSNDISIPILMLLYSLLHSPSQPTLHYYTREPKRVAYEILKLEKDKMIAVEFDPMKKKNLEQFKLIFRYFPNIDEIFEGIKNVPEQHQLFILAVIFWLNRSSYANSIYLQSVLIGLIANIVDKKCEKYHRDFHKFNKNYKKFLDEAKSKIAEAKKENVNDLEIDLAKMSLKEDEFSQMTFRNLTKNVTKTEAVLTMEGIIGYYSISPKFERRHADFKKNVVHGYAELQGVIMNMNSLVPFLNYPFEAVRMESSFSALFLYNVYNSLKSRTNPLEYIENHLFNHSSSLLSYFRLLYNFCSKMLPKLKQPEMDVKPVRVKRSIKKVKKIVVRNDCAVKDDSESETQFNDLNNKFSELLKNYL